MHADGFDDAITAENSGLARAYWEQAEDGSCATTIFWNNNIRLTTVIDAPGAETRYYYDILGYTYRIVYPAITAADGKIYEHEEWFFRDANKNVTVHVHPDGGKDVYRYDAQSNLLAHTRADDSTVHFAHDELDNLTGILDAEGNRWERSYDGINLVEEVNPLGHSTTYAYNEDALGRRIAKHTVPLGQSQQLPTEDGQWGATLLGWDGDQMAWEADYARRQTVHHVFEPNCFVPLLQGTCQADIRKMFLERPYAPTSEYFDAVLHRRT